MPQFSFGSVLEDFASGAIDEFFAEFHTNDGFALPSRYEVIFLPPVGTRGTGESENTNIFSKIMSENTSEGTTREVGLRCQSISLPGRNIDTAPDENIYGPVREIAQGFSFADITATFQCSPNMRERKFFETWQRLSFNPQTWAMGYYDDYSGGIQIFQLDQGNRRRYGCEIVECFPKTIGELSYSADPATNVQTVDVTFSYRYWKSLADEASLPKPLGDRITGVLGNTVERQLLSQIPKVLSKL